MSLQLSIIVSSKLENSQKDQLKGQLLKKWPFLRRLKEHEPSDHLLLSLPELTENAYDSYVKLERVIEQNESVRNELNAFSGETGDTALAYIEAICFGESCIYTGIVCRGGSILTEEDPDQESHIKLFEPLGINAGNGALFFRKDYEDGTADDIPAAAPDSADTMPQE